MDYIFSFSVKLKKFWVWWIQCPASQRFVFLIYITTICLISFLILSKIHYLPCILLLSWKYIPESMSQRLMLQISELDLILTHNCCDYLIIVMTWLLTFKDKQLFLSSAKWSLSPTAFNQTLCLSTCLLFLPTPIANRHNSSVLHDINNQGQLENDPQCNLALPSAWEASHFSLLPPSCPTPLCPHPLSLQTSELYTILTYVYTFPASECWHMTN